jgi:hypothetical protein
MLNSPAAEKSRSVARSLAGANIHGNGWDGSRGWSGAPGRQTLSCGLIAVGDNRMVGLPSTPSRGGERVSARKSAGEAGDDDGRTESRLRQIEMAANIGFEGCVGETDKMGVPAIGRPRWHFKSGED